MLKALHCVIPWLCDVGTCPYLLSFHRKSTLCPNTWPTSLGTELPILPAQSNCVIDTLPQRQAHDRLLRYNGGDKGIFCYIELRKRRDPKVFLKRISRQMLNLCGLNQLKILAIQTDQYQHWNYSTGNPTQKQRSGKGVLNRLLQISEFTLGCF